MVQRRQPRRRRSPGGGRRLARVALGNVLHYVRTGHLVVEMESDGGRLPPLGAGVETEDGRRVGVLADVIGPVERPYAVVKVDRELGVEPESLAGVKVYAVFEVRQSARGRRGPGGERRGQAKARGGAGRRERPGRGRQEGRRLQRGRRPGRGAKRRPGGGRS